MDSPVRLTLNDVKGDIFSVPKYSVIIHACNCLGIWGSGIAAAIRGSYPGAYEVYATHCASAEKDPESLLGTTLLIPPQKGDSKKHWIACLFTSVGFGKQVSPPAEIIASTETAFAGLLTEYLDLKGKRDEKIASLVACQFNSERFGVPWEKTVETLYRVANGGDEAERKVAMAVVERGSKSLKKLAS